MPKKTPTKAQMAAKHAQETAALKDEIATLKRQTQAAREGRDVPAKDALMYAIAKRVEDRDTSTVRHFFFRQEENGTIQLSLDEV